MILMDAIDLGTMAYREAWRRQEEAHEEVVAGGAERVLLVEHPPVITFGRRGPTPHLLASEQALAEAGVELVCSDRGGDVTFHGPGQLVAYPIVRIADHGLSVGSYVHALERAVIATLGRFGIEGAHADPKAVGVWLGDGPRAEKVCAIGVRIKRGVTLHGLALNVTTDLRYFDLITPCGLAGRGVTSLARLLGERCPAMGDVRLALVEELRRACLRPAARV